jgi:hypothetical protein
MPLPGVVESPPDRCRHCVQWIVLRNDGATTAAAYAMEGARAGVTRRGIGGTDFLVLCNSSSLFTRRHLVRQLTAWYRFSHLQLKLDT